MSSSMEATGVTLRQRRTALGRRTWRGVAAVLAVGAALSGCWFQPGFSPRRNGHNNGETGLTSANVTTLTQAWSVNLGTGPVSGPTISQNGVHAVSGQVLNDRRLADGSPGWSVRVLPDGAALHVGAPSVRDGRVLVGTDRGDLNHAGLGVHSYDAATGTGDTMVSTRPLDGAVTVDGSTLAFTARVESLDLGEVALFLNVVDLDDASQSWESFLHYGLLDSPPVTSVALGRRELFLGMGNDVLAFTRAKPAVCPPGSSPPSCTPAWTRTLAGTVTQPVLSDDETTIYVGDSGGNLTAFDAFTRATLWTASIGGTGAPQVLAAPTLGDGLLYVTSTTGRFHAFDADGCGHPTCSPIWTGNTGSPIKEQAALAGGVLYIGSDNGTVKAYLAAGCGPANCNPVWQVATGSRITGAPAVGLGNLVVGTADGRLIAYRPS